jgi:hypothetical protein
MFLKKKKFDVKKKKDDVLKKIKFWHFAAKYVWVTSEVEQETNFIFYLVRLVSKMSKGLDTKSNNKIMSIQYRVSFVIGYLFSKKMLSIIIEP